MINWLELLCLPSVVQSWMIQFCICTPSPGHSLLARTSLIQDLSLFCTPLPQVEEQLLHSPQGFQEGLPKIWVYIRIIANTQYKEICLQLTSIHLT